MLNEFTETVCLRVAALKDDGRRSVTIGVMLIVLVFGIGGWLLYRVQLASAVVAAGVFKVADNRKTVQHLEGGIIKEIAVRDGDHVTAGQTLIVLADERVQANVDLLAGQRDAVAAKAARLQAEAGLARDIRFPDELTARASEANLAELLRVETASFTAKRAALDRQVALIGEQISEVEQEQVDLRAQLSAGQAASQLADEELQLNEKAAQRDLVPKVKVLSLRRAVEEQRARLAELNGASSRSRQREKELRGRTTILTNQYRQAATDELPAVNAQLFDLNEKLRPSQDAVKRQIVTAPISGTVVNLQVFTVGGVVKPGDQLLDVVPDNEPLVIEARVRIDDIDEVRPSLPTDIRLTAYPTRTTPLLNGTVRYVSADQLTDPRSGEAYYVAQIAVSDRFPGAIGDDLDLQPGMGAEIFIRTAGCSILDYLVSPITDSLRRAMRES